MNHFQLVIEWSIEHDKERYSLPFNTLSGGTIWLN
jgi:hypothetical protein